MFGLRGVVVLGPIAAAADALDGRATDGPYDLNDIIYEPFVSVELCGDFCNCLIDSWLLSTNCERDLCDPVTGVTGNKLNRSPYGNCKG